MKINQDIQFSGNFLMIEQRAFNLALLELLNPYIDSTDSWTYDEEREPVIRVELKTNINQVELIKKLRDYAK